MMLVSNSRSRPPSEDVNHSAARLDQQQRMRRKRRASNDHHTSNERLSKRLGLLNLDNTGSRSYIPTETSPSAPSSVNQAPVLSPQLAATTRAVQAPGANRATPDTDTDTDDPMLPITEPSSFRTRSSTLYSTDSDPEQQQQQQQHDYNHDYDYDISSSSESDSESSSPNHDRLIIHPSMRQHLREQRRKPLVPRHILPNQDGELASMQMVLYSEPSSLTVPESLDSVRRAVVEARARLRSMQTGGGGGTEEMRVREVWRDTGSGMIREEVSLGGRDVFGRGGGGGDSHPPPFRDVADGDDAMDID